MGRIEYSIEINAPIEKVFAYFSDPKNKEKIFADSNCKIEDITKHPDGVGTRFRISAIIGKLNVKPHLHEFIEFEKNRRIVEREVKGGGGSLKKEDLILFLVATNKGTNLTLTEEYEPPYSILGKLVDKLVLRKGLERFIQSATLKAKEILEAA